MKDSKKYTVIISNSVNGPDLVHNPVKLDIRNHIFLNFIL